MISLDAMFGVFPVAKIHLRVEPEFLRHLRSSLSLHFHGSSLYITPTYKWVSANLMREGAGVLNHSVERVVEIPNFIK